MTDTTPPTAGVDFLCSPAQNFDAMTAFYGQTLGLPFVKRYGSRPGAEFQAGGHHAHRAVRRHILAQRDADRSPSQRRSRRARALEAKIVRFVSDTFDSGVCRQAICLGPDGNLLALSTATP